jgi:hypothetical protein
MSNITSSEETYQCERCNKKFKTKRTLKVHNTTSKCANNEYNNKLYCCDFCKKSLSTKQMLKHHLTKCKDVEISKQEVKFQKHLVTMQKKYIADVLSLQEKYQRELKDFCIDLQQKFNTDLFIFKDEFKQQFFGNLKLMNDNTNSSSLNNEF